MGGLLYWWPCSGWGPYISIWLKFLLLKKRKQLYRGFKIYHKKTPTHTHDNIDVLTEGYVSFLIKRTPKSLDKFEDYLWKGYKKRLHDLDGKNYTLGTYSTVLYNQPLNNTTRRHTNIEFGYQKVERLSPFRDYTGGRPKEVLVIVKKKHISKNKYKPKMNLKQIDSYYFTSLLGGGQYHTYINERDFSVITVPHTNYTTFYSSKNFFFFLKNIKIELDCKPSNVIADVISSLVSYGHTISKPTTYPKYSYKKGYCYGISKKTKIKTWIRVIYRQWSATYIPGRGLVRTNKDDITLKDRCTGLGKLAGGYNFNPTLRKKKDLHLDGNKRTWWKRQANLRYLLFGSQKQPIRLSKRNHNINVNPLQYNQLDQNEPVSTFAIISPQPTRTNLPNFNEYIVGLYAKKIKKKKQPYRKAMTITSYIPKGMLIPRSVWERGYWYYVKGGVKKKKKTKKKRGPGKKQRKLVINDLYSKLISLYRVYKQLIHMTNGPTPGYINGVLYCFLNNLGYSQVKKFNKIVLPKRQVGWSVSTPNKTAHTQSRNSNNLTILTETVEYHYTTNTILFKRKKIKKTPTKFRKKHEKDQFWHTNYYSSQKKKKQISILKKTKKLKKKKHKFNPKAVLIKDPNKKETPKMRKGLPGYWDLVVVNNNGPEPTKLVIKTSISGVLKNSEMKYGQKKYINGVLLDQTPRMHKLHTAQKKLKYSNMTQHIRLGCKVLKRLPHKDQYKMVSGEIHKSQYSTHVKSKICSSHRKSRLLGYLYSRGFLLKKGYYRQKKKRMVFRIPKIKYGRGMGTHISRNKTLKIYSTAQKRISGFIITQTPPSNTRRQRLDRVKTMGDFGNPGRLCGYFFNDYLKAPIVNKYFRFFFFTTYYLFQRRTSIIKGWVSYIKPRLRRDEDAYHVVKRKRYPWGKTKEYRAQVNSILRFKRKVISPLYMNPTARRIMTDRIDTLVYYGSNLTRVKLLEKQYQSENAPIRALGIKLYLMSNLKKLYFELGAYILMRVIGYGTDRIHCDETSAYKTLSKNEQVHNVAIELFYGEDDTHNINTTYDTHDWVLPILSPNFTETDRQYSLDENWYGNLRKKPVRFVKKIKKFFVKLPKRKKKVVYKRRLDKKKFILRRRFVASPHIPTPRGYTKLDLPHYCLIFTKLYYNYPLILFQNTSRPYPNGLPNYGFCKSSGHTNTLHNVTVGFGAYQWLVVILQKSFGIPDGYHHQCGVGYATLILNPHIVSRNQPKNLIIKLLLRFAGRRMGTADVLFSEVRGSETAVTVWDYKKQPPGLHKKPATKHGLGESITTSNLLSAPKPHTNSYMYNKFLEKLKTNFFWNSLVICDPRKLILGGVCKFFGEPGVGDVIYLPIRIGDLARSIQTDMTFVSSSYYLYLWYEYDTIRKRGIMFFNYSYMYEKGTSTVPILVRRSIRPGFVSTFRFSWVHPINLLSPDQWVYFHMLDVDAEWHEEIRQSRPEELPEYLYSTDTDLLNPTRGKPPEEWSDFVDYPWKLRKGDPRVDYAERILNRT